MAITPFSANSSHKLRTQSVRPKISLMTSTAGALSLRSGYTTNALIERAPDLISTQSPWRGELLSRSRPKSLTSSAASTEPASSASANAKYFIPSTNVGFQKLRASGRSLAQHYIEAPRAWTIKENVKEKK